MFLSGTPVSKGHKDYLKNDILVASNHTKNTVGIIITLVIRLARNIFFFGIWKRYNTIRNIRQFYDQSVL